MSILDFVVISVLCFFVGASCYCVCWGLRKLWQFWRAPLLLLTAALSLNAQTYSPSNPPPEGTWVALELGVSDFSGPSNVGETIVALTGYRWENGQRVYYSLLVEVLPETHGTTAAALAALPVWTSGVVQNFKKGIHPSTGWVFASSLPAVHRSLLDLWHTGTDEFDLFVDRPNPTDEPDPGDVADSLELLGNILGQDYEPTGEIRPPAAAGANNSPNGELFWLQWSDNLTSNGWQTHLIELIHDADDWFINTLTTTDYASDGSVVTTGDATAPVVEEAVELLGRANTAENSGTVAEGDFGEVLLGGGAQAEQLQQDEYGGGGTAWQPGAAGADLLEEQQRTTEGIAAVSGQLDGIDRRLSRANSNLGDLSAGVDAVASETARRRAEAAQQHEELVTAIAGIEGGGGGGSGGTITADGATNELDTSALQGQADEFESWVPDLPTVPADTDWSYTMDIPWAGGGTETFSITKPQAGSDLRTWYDFMSAGVRALLAVVFIWGFVFSVFRTLRQY